MNRFMSHVRQFSSKVLQDDGAGIPLYSCVLTHQTYSSAVVCGQPGFSPETG